MRLARSLTILGIVALGASLYVTHSRTYFFLFDDYSVVGQASSIDLRTIFRVPAINFYRPLTFVLLKAAYYFFGWSRPDGYLLLSTLLHLANSVLLFMIAQALGFSLIASAAATLIFVLCAWSTEATLWASGVFDLAATLGVLGAILCCIRVGTARSSRVAVLFGLTGVAFSLFALFAKESAVTLPLVLVPILWMRSGLNRVRASICVAGAVACTATYLLVREAILPGLSGAYGDISTLFGAAPLGQNYVRFLAAYVLPPFPTSGYVGLTGILGLTLPFLVAVLPALVVAVAVRHARQATLCLIAASVSVIPVLWVTFSIMNTTHGRFLYLPGAWIALLLGLCANALVERCVGRSRLRQIALTVALGVLIAYYSASMLYQMRLWNTATGLARATMKQLPARVTGSAPLNIINLPFRCEEGPYILKTYAFRYYYQNWKLPPVRSQALIIECDSPTLAVVADSPDVYSEYSGSASDEREIQLAFPVPIRAPEVRR